MSFDDFIPPTMYKLDGTSVAELTNPITRFQVRVEPPYPLGEDFNALYRAFAAYCEKAWVEGEAPNKYRISPAVVDPYKLIDGTMPLPDLHQALKDLVNAFGYWAVDGALGRERGDA